MVALLAAALLAAAPAQAGMTDPAVTVGPDIGVLGPGASLSARPGLRLGFEPDRRFAAEAFYSVMFANIWNAGIAPEARWFLSDHARKGVYLGGRMPLGLIGDMASAELEGTATQVTTDSTDTEGSIDLTADAGPAPERRLGAAVALQAGVGWRFSEIVGIEIMAGPEWDGIFGMNWRATAALEIIMHNDPDPDAPPRPPRR